MVKLFFGMINVFVTRVWRLWVGSANPRIARYAGTTDPASAFQMVSMLEALSNEAPAGQFISLGSLLLVKLAQPTIIQMAGLLVLHLISQLVFSSGMTGLARLESVRQVPQLRCLFLAIL